MEGAVDQPRHIPLPVLLVPFTATVIAGYVADATWPGLVDTHPLVLLMLSARLRYMVLVAPFLDPVSFFVVGFFRLVLTDPIAYVIGRQHGERAIAWAERLSDTAAEDSLVRRMERWFSRAAAVFIIVAPSFIWCLMAGAGRMRVSVFAACNVIGTAGRLLLVWWLGETFEDGIQSVLDVVKDIRLPLLAVTVPLVIWQVTKAVRGGQFQTPDEIEHELEDLPAAE